MKKKIVIACLGHDLSGGGAERVALQLLSLLNRELFSIELSYLRDYGELHGLIPPDLSPCFFVDGSARFRHTLVKGFRKYREVARKADLLFGMMEGIPIYLVSLIGALEKKPSVGWNHITTSQSFADLNRVHRVLMPLLYPRVSQMVCVSDGARSDLLNLCRFRTRAPITIHNSLDANAVRAKGLETVPETARSWYHRPTVVGVGRFVAQKRIDRLIQAFASAVHHGLDANLILLGQGPLQHELHSLTDDLGIKPRVFFAGFQSNPYPYIRAASVLAMSSDYEGFGMVLLEAMALGTAVISTDCPSGPREILQDGRNGILTPVGDIEGMANAIATLLRDPALRRSYVNNGLERVEEFNPVRIVQQFENLFLQLVPL